MQFHYEDEEKVVKCEKSQRYIFETLKSIYVLEFSRETDRMYIYNIYDIDRYRDWKENVCGGGGGTWKISSPLFAMKLKPF